MIKYVLVIKSNHWPRRLNKLRKIIKNVIDRKNYLSFNKKTNYYCNFVLSNDLFIKKFNRRYKKNNNSTDVLTFVSKIQKNNILEKHCDIIISAETLSKNAKKNKINFYDHFVHIVVHSLLHIKGYRHNNKNNFLIMKKKEIKILKQLSISNPY